MAKKRSNKRRLRALEQRLTTLEREHADVAKRTKKLAKRVEALRTRRPSSERVPSGRARSARCRSRSGGPGGPGGPNYFWRRPGGGPPWRKQFGPVVSLEVPLETDDPSAPCGPPSRPVCPRRSPPWATTATSSATAIRPSDRPPRPPATGGSRSPTTFSCFGAAATLRTCDNGGLTFPGDGAVATKHGRHQGADRRGRWSRGQEGTCPSLS